MQEELLQARAEMTQLESQTQSDPEKAQLRAEFKELEVIAASLFDISADSVIAAIICRSGGAASGDCISAKGTASVHSDHRRVACGC
jgi:hypothetical protein